jgi:betaine-homocysteine S-methyltransferase
MSFFFRAGREYWEKLEPATGRPYSQSLARPDNWEVSRGHELFKQHAEATSAKEMSDVKSFRKG